MIELFQEVISLKFPIGSYKTTLRLENNAATDMLSIRMYFFYWQCVSLYYFNFTVY